MKFKQTYIFNKHSSTDTSTSKNEHCFICDEDDPWDVILRQFAMFLDQSGYVGVYENVEMMLEDRELDRWTQLDLTEDDEE